MVYTSTILNRFDIQLLLLPQCTFDYVYVQVYLVNINSRSSSLSPSSFIDIFQWNGCNSRYIQALKTLSRNKKAAKQGTGTRNDERKSREHKAIKSDSILFPKSVI